MKRLRPDEVSGTGLIMATAAKKHVTVFRHKGSAPGAGRPEVKEAFMACAAETVGEPVRMKRNIKVKECMERKGLRTGVTHRKSGARPGSPLYGKTRTCDTAGCRYE